MVNNLTVSALTIAQLNHVHWATKPDSYNS